MELFRLPKVSPAVSRSYAWLDVTTAMAPHTFEQALVAS